MANLENLPKLPKVHEFPKFFSERVKLFEFLGLMADGTKGIGELASAATGKALDVIMAFSSGTAKVRAGTGRPEEVTPCS